MILGDVLRILSNYCNALGMGHNDLYILLFEEEDVNLDQTVKNAFKDRGINQRIYKKLLTDEGFVHLTKIINEKLLSAIGNHPALYQDIYHLIEQDTHFSDAEKQLVLSSFNPDDQAQLAQLIALCIICGNYNLPGKKSLHMANQANYGINLTKFTSNSESLIMEHELWKASQRDFFASRRLGGRFSSLNIITQLLPKGFIAEPDFLIKGKTENGPVRSVMELCAENDEHIAVIGNGGIGKTTFLHQLMTEVYAQKVLSDSGNDVLQPLPYQSGLPVPFFIELNRCPKNIDTWYEDSLHKTNFITRYVAQILENHASPASVSHETLDKIEKEFQKIPAKGKPRYLLLLDGFNEVTASQGHSIRTYLSNEISVLSQYPNLRIITTSRETQAAYYASDFKNIRLVGLENEDILAYLKKCHMSETQIGSIMACKPLVECLRIPLYICMFCAEDTGAILPETPGEILYNFFHKNSSFYNIRSRAADTRTNPLGAQQTAFVLDFILPYIGWQMETNDCFSVNESNLKVMIETAIFSISVFCGELETIPYADFHYRSAELLNTAKSLGNFSANFDKKPLQKIIDCIYSYLGIVYQYQANEGNFGDRNRYAFSHHQFRDYFSAMWDIQLLTLIQCMDKQDFFRSYPHHETEVSCANYLNIHYWQNHKAEFISQILMEHQNKPLLYSQTQNWYLPKPESDEQKVLTHVLTFCRNLANQDIHYLLQNVLSAILKGRKELSGVNLSGLNLSGCNLFNITCSRKGKSATLAANFQGSILEQRSFEPESHQDNVIDYLYNGNRCFTLDDNGRLKCWDILSGKMEYEYQFPDPTGINDFSTSGFLKISPDRKWLATKIQESRPDGMKLGIQLLTLTEPKKCMQFVLKHANAKVVNYFAFTGDSRGILLLTDYKNICCFSLPNLKTIYAFTCPDLMKRSTLYAKTAASSIYVFTAEYNLYTDVEDLDEAEEWDLEEEEEIMEENIGVPCQICRLYPTSKRFHILQSFVSTPQAEPTATYLPQKNAFLYYDYTTREIIYFDCVFQRAHAVLQELTTENPFQPSYIHLRPGHPEECYIMYPDDCYLIDMQNSENISVIMKYPVSGLHKLLEGTEQEGELYFKTAVVPNQNRFLVSNDTTTYEWNTEEDTLFPRYNLLYYSCAGLIRDTMHKQCILVHMNNGISVFAEDPARLKNSFCFEEPDYYISGCCYCVSKQLLALTFSRSDHEKVLILNLSNSEEMIVFSTIHSHETVENINFDKNEKHLLIATTHQCCEYILDSRTMHSIRETLEGERIAGADYQEDTIEIVITQNKQNQKITVSDRCEYFQRHRYLGNITYSCQGFYLLPELTDELIPYFIFQHGDLGVQGPVDEKGMQEYWITSGFFPIFQKTDVNLPVLETYTKAGKKEFLTIDPYRYIYFKHRKALEYQYRQKNTGFSYSFLDDGSGEAIFMENSESIFYHSHYTDCSYEELRNGLSQNLGSYGGKVYWDYAVSYGENQMLVCYETYKLMVLNTRTGKELYDVSYTPGLAIYGCNFYGVKAEKELLAKLQQNGGIM